MACQTLKGVYRNGQIELLEKPAHVGESAPVLVTFLSPEDVSEPPEDREQRRRRAFERMEQGIDLGGPPYPKRDELYDRFKR